jgi:hypothetical protein
MSYLHSPERITAWFFSKFNDPSLVIDLHQAKGSGTSFIHRQSSHSDISVRLTVHLDEMLVIHTVQVISCQDHVLQNLGFLKEPEVLPHSIRSSLHHAKQSIKHTESLKTFKHSVRLEDVETHLEPVGILRALLGSQDLHEAFVLVPAHVAGIGSGQVPVQRRGIELREHVDLVDVAVDAVADRNVNQPVVSPQGHRWLRTLLRQWVQPAPRSTTENNPQHTLQHIHTSSQSAKQTKYPITACTTTHLCPA